MTDTVFVNGTPIVPLWLNDVNNFTYRAPDSSNAAYGDALIAYKRTITGAVASTLHLWHEKSFIMPTDFGTVGDGVTDDTVNAQKFWNAVYNSSLCGYIPDNHNMSVTGISVTVTGSRLSNAFKVVGGGRATSKMTKRGATATPVLTIDGGVGSEPNLYLADFGLFGNSKVSPGLTLNGVGQFLIERLLLTGHTTGIELKSSLIGTVQFCEITDNNSGTVTSRTGTNSYVNIVQFKSCRFRANTSFAADLDRANMLTFEDCTFETNGTAANTGTGIFMIRANYGTEVGFGQLFITRAWMEGNSGRAIQNEVPATAFQDVFIKGGHCINQESGQCLLVTGIRRLEITAWQCPSAIDTANISCDQLLIESSYIAIVTLTSVANPIIHNLSTVARDHIEGWTETWTATATGYAVNPTSTVTTIQNGKDIEHRFVDTTGTSNANTFTITGMPARFRPAANVNSVVILEDNGIDDAAQLVIASTGVMTGLWRGGVFTTSGTKGIRAGSVRYRL